MRFNPFILLSGLALLAASARAGLEFALTPAARSAVGNNATVFTGTLTNTSLTDELFLNNIQFTFTGEAEDFLGADTNVFFANVPGVLLPGEIYSDVVVGIIVAPPTPPGQYSGSITIQGGADIFAATNLAGRAFEISLPPAALDIAPAGTNLLLAWSSPPGGFALQQNSDLATTNWLAMTNVPALTNGRNQVILAPANGAEFYRLKYP